jgi:hypothetical protein
MTFVNQLVEEPKKSLRDYASPRCEDIRVQESDSKLEATKYEIKSKIIEMAVANPFDRGARGLQAFDLPLLTNYSNPNYD